MQRSKTAVDVFPRPGLDKASLGTGQRSPTRAGWSDGDPEVARSAQAHSKYAQHAVWLLDGNVLRGGGSVGTAPSAGWQIKGTGDFDGDGKGDILWQNTSGQAAVWLLDGNNLRGGGNVGTAPSAGWRIKGAGDFDGDSKGDILWQNTSGQAAVWLLDGNSLRGGGSVSTPPSAGWQIVNADSRAEAGSDFDGDGKSDILWQNSTTGQAQAWLMNGIGMRSESNIGSAPSAGWQIASGA